MNSKYEKVKRNLFLSKEQQETLSAADVEVSRRFTAQKVKHNHSRPVMQCRPIYFNQPQRENMMVAAKNTYVIASRGLGKSEGFDAVFCLRNMLEMPRSCGGFVSPTYAKALQNTLPAICHALAKWGYLPNRHYSVGVRPPKSAGFAVPHIVPFNYDNVLSFYNGSIIHILSLDRPMSANSMSLDWLLLAEAKYIDYKKFKSEILPANRGNRQYFDACPHHHSILATTDMPTSSLGSWIFEKKEEMDAELIAGIKSAYHHCKSLESKASTPYLQRMVKNCRVIAKQNASNAETFADTIIRVLKSNGYEVHLNYIGNPKRHNWKHKEIDRALKGDDDLLFPRFNLPNNEYLKLALEQAGVKTGRNGFEKDKSAEHHPDSPENPLETQTHITDAWDTLFIAANFYADNIEGASVGGGVFL